MSDCFFCGSFVGEENGDGGCKGRQVGNKDICEQCLGEFKHWLNGTIPRSPSMRENKIDDEDGLEAEKVAKQENENKSESTSSSSESDLSDENEEESSNPFSAAPVEE